jgi:hypothetical protein
MWQVPFENITKVLEVYDWKLEPHEYVADQVTTDLLLHRAPLPGVDCSDKDIDLTLLSSHLSGSETSARHLVYDSALRIVHDLIRYGNCTTMPSNKPRLDAVGR